MKIYIENTQNGSLIPMDLFLLAQRMIVSNFAIVDEGSEKFSMHDNTIYLDDCDIEIDYQDFANELEHCAQSLLLDHEK